MNSLLSAALLGLMSLQAPVLPPAHFTGTLHTIEKKKITVDTPEGNVEQFEINKKTAIEVKGKSVDLKALHAGVMVAIEARQELLGYLIAVKISVQ